MRRIFLIGIITILLCSLLHFFHPWTDTYSYYCPEIDFSFQMREELDATILIIEETDSIYMSPLRGQYCGVNFYIHADSNILFMEKIYNFPKTVFNKYKIKYLQRDKKFSLDLTPLGDSYYTFKGGCDQGHHTFLYFDESSRGHLLEPIEWGK